MTKSETLKKHWYAPVVVGLGVVGALYSLDMVPWPKKAETATKAELASVEARAIGEARAIEDVQNEVHKALIQRIESGNAVMIDFIGEQRRFNRRQERQMDKVISNTNKP
jgi:hypothetical protein